MPKQPVAIGLLACEHAVIEEKTRNVTPVNCFWQRTVTKFPSEPFPFVVYAVLTDGFGEVELEISIQRLDKFEDIYQRRLMCKFADPLHEIRCLFRIRDCTFPVAGYYQIQLLSQNELIAQKKIRIIQKETSK